MRTTATARFLTLALVCVLLACKQSGTDPDNSSGSSSSLPAKRVALDVKLGSDTFKLTPSTKGYTIADGAGAVRGEIKVEPDRVKLKNAAGAELAKVKAKDYGFKVYAGDDKLVLKGKQRDAGYKFEREDQSELGKTDAANGTLAGNRVEAKLEAGRWSVTRAGATVASVDGSVAQPVALLLALSEITPEQRVALLVFEREVGGR